jgi:hypothetical protein
VTACRVCEPKRSDYVLGVRRVPELDAQLERDLQAIREAERSVDLNMRIGEPWTGWTMEAEPQTVSEVLEELGPRPAVREAMLPPVSVRPRHRRPVKRTWWKFGR